MFTDYSVDTLHICNRHGVLLESKTHKGRDALSSEHLAQYLR